MGKEHTSWPPIGEGKELVQLSLCLMGQVKPKAAREIGQVLHKYLAFLTQEGTISRAERERYSRQAKEILQQIEEGTHVH